MSGRKPNKENGYNMNLYRRPADGWFFGVCAGLAKHFEVPEWMARLIAVTLFLFTGELAILLYIAAVFLLARHPAQRSGRRSGRAGCGGKRRQKKSDRSRSEGEEEFGEEGGSHREHLFTYGPSPAARLKEMKSRLAAIDQRLRSMEKYVTSRKYQFNQEFRDL